MIFSEEYCSRIEDFGRGGLMTPEAVLRIFENTGSHHSDSVGDSLISGTAAGVAWIVAEWNVRIHRTPAYGEKLIQSTYAVGLKPSIQCKRRMEIRTAAGELCAEGNAVLVRVDVSTGRLVKPAEELIALYRRSRRMKRMKGFRALSRRRNSTPKSPFFSVGTT
ncbi:MAG: acyl-ACP thioesterase domain-containing protein [Eubacteriales bacterium]